MYYYSDNKFIILIPKPLLMAFSSTFQDTQYPQGPYFFPPFRGMCHTASITSPAGKDQALMMQVSP